MNNQLYKVLIAPPARQAIRRTKAYIRKESGRARASIFAESLVNYCNRELERFPYKFEAYQYDNELRITNHQGTTIIYEVDEEHKEVQVLYFFGRGMDYDAILNNEKNIEYTAN